MKSDGPRIGDFGKGEGATSMLTPVDKRSLAVEVAGKLRLEILMGRIRPGARILEQEISMMMKTSRSPVRDALLQLEHEGLVRREPNHSATVVRMTADDVEEVHSLRLSLELLAMRYVMERAREEDLARLQAAAAALRTHMEGDFSLQHAVDLDLQFHEELVRTARHSRLLSMWQSIKPQIWFLIFTRNTRELESYREVVRTHEKILQAIREKDPVKGESLVQEHLDESYANLIATYRKSDRPEGDRP
jgi:DNA-binding GntR family transcriptional regulator